MKKGIWASAILAGLYCAWGLYLLITALHQYNPDAWGAGLVFLNVEIFTIWGMKWMEFIGGPAFLTNVSPWAYLFPIMINSALIFLIGFSITRWAKH
jgi:hypothetical protein